jgi:DNA polymerase-3 subunit alpha (Gram-positive type)
LDIDSIGLTEVEVIPNEGKWILHLSACNSLSAEDIDRLTECLTKAVGNEIKIECHFDLRGNIEEYSPERGKEKYERREGQEACATDIAVISPEDTAMENETVYSMPPTDMEAWISAFNELSEDIPALKGWINSNASIAVDGEIMTFLVPNLVVMESLKSRQDVIVDFLARKFGFRYKVCWEIREETDYSECVSAEIEEQKYVEQIMAVAAAEKKKENKESDVVIGRAFKGEAIPLRNINDEEKQAVIQGEVCETEMRKLKSGRQLFTFGITDKTNSLGCKIFLEEGQPEPNISKGDCLRIRGPIQFDRYTTELTLMARDIVKIPNSVRMDTAEVKRVELHLHTKMSEMDAVSSAKSLVQRAILWGHKAIAITDHGVVQAFPDAVEAGAKAGIKVILGMEGYLVEDDPKNKDIIMLLS